MTQNPDWQAGFNACKKQAAELVRLYSSVLDLKFSDDLQLDPERHKAGGLLASRKRWIAATMHPSHSALTFIAAAIKAMPPPGPLPIEKIAMGFPTEGDDPEYGAEFLARDLEADAKNWLDFDFDDGETS